MVSMQKLIIFLYASKSNWKMKLSISHIVPALCWEPSDGILLHSEQNFKSWQRVTRPSCCVLSSPHNTQHVPDPAPQFPLPRLLSPVPALFPHLPHSSFPPSFRCLPTVTSHFGFESSHHHPCSTLAIRLLPLFLLRT